MTTLERSRNVLLAQLRPDDRAALDVHLKPIVLHRAEVLVESDQAIDRIVFPRSGVVSVIRQTIDDRRIEIGLFGREGMLDGSLLIGVDRVPHSSVVQIAGHGHEIAADILTELAGERPELRRVLQRWVHVFGLQVAQTVVANTGYNVEARLARWLLMCHDRMADDDIALTHHFLSVMLAVRRSTVTSTLHLFEEIGLIRNPRGQIRIADRQGLLARAGEAYGMPEAEYERIIGKFRVG